PPHAARAVLRLRQRPRQGAPMASQRRELVKVVAIGGGTGLPVVLTALRRHLAAGDRITAVVTAADDGGSSGILRREYGVIPPGDIRNCLLALARVAPEVSAALQYRFDGSVAQHPVGNLLLAALDMVAADGLTAIRLAAELLGVGGVAEAVTESSAVRIFVCNAMTEPGETDGYGIAEHLQALAEHGLPLDKLHYVVAHTTPIPSKVLGRYASEGAVPVDPDLVLPDPSPVTIRADLLELGPVVRHNPDKLGPILCDLASRRRDTTRTLRVTAQV